MPDRDSGVTDSTVDPSADLALLNDEGEIQDERKAGVPMRPAPIRGPEKKDEPDDTPDEAEKPPEEAPKDEDESKDEDKDKESRPPIHDRPTMQQLREEFPELFKKFPSLRDIYYREQEFTQIFPTVEDAKESAAYSSSFTELTDKVLRSDTEGILTAIKETDGKAFSKISQDILPTLYKMSPDLHWQATLPLMQNLVRGFYLDGKRRGDENVINSAEYLSDFIFGDIKIARGEKSVVPERDEESEERKELNAERAKFFVDRVDSFTAAIKTQADETLRRSVTEGGKVDPDGVFSDFIKETIVGKVLQEVDNQLVADKAHMRYMSSLWDKAKREGFNDEWKSRILSAYLARAKSLIPTVRAKFVSEAQGGAARASAKKNEITDRNATRREPGSGRTSREGGNGALDAKRIDWSQTSDMDLLEDRITFRK